MLAVVEVLRGRGVRSRRLAVSHGFHSPLMEPMLDEYRAVAESLTYRRPTIPIVSTVTGRAADPDELCHPDYWVRHARDAVRFGDAVHTMIESGVTTFVEVGPDSVLSGLVGEIAPPDGYAALPMLRRDQPEPDTVTALLGNLHARGVPVDWAAYFGGRARRVTLPTYPFQRERYWLAPSPAETEPGQRSRAHPMLGPMIPMAGSDEVRFTSRISVQDHPWLADHVVVDDAVLPTTAFVELAIRAGDGTGYPVLEHLSVDTPLLLPPQGAIRVQVVLGGPDRTGGRTVTIHAGPDEPDAPWTRYAHGRLVPDQATVAAPAESPGAPDDEVVQVQLPVEQHPDAGRYGLHPALLDQALPAVPGADTIRVPVRWTGVRLHTTGATSGHARRTVIEDERVRLVLVDGDGQPIVSAESVTFRSFDPAELTSATATDPHLHQLEWHPIARVEPDEAFAWAAITRADRPADHHEVDDGPAVVEDDGPAVVEFDRVAAVGDVVASGPPLHAVLVELDTGTPGDPVTEVHTLVRNTLDLVRSWLADDRLDAVRLVLTTRGGVAVDGGDVADLAGAALWGLLRAVQARHPGRIVLVDLEDHRRPVPLLSAVLAAGEPQAAIRGGQVVVPRLARVPEPGSDAPLPGWNPEGTVLVTGAAAPVAGLVTRHLVVNRGVTRLLLTGHGTAEHAVVDELATRLRELGARVTTEDCDPADRDRLADLLDRVPAEQPLAAIVHVVGLTEAPAGQGDPAQDGHRGLPDPTVDGSDALTRSTIDGAWHLHELTRDRALSAFVLLSSVVAAFDRAGSPMAAISNAFLDALAHRRRALGLPATALALGPMSDIPAVDAGADSGPPGSGPVDSQVEGRAPVPFDLRPTAPARVPGRLDAALAADRPALAALALDLAAVRTAGRVPPLLRGLVRMPQRRDAHVPVPEVSLAHRLAGLDEADRYRAVLKVVREQVAAVLGRGDPGSVGVDRPFQDLGFDSLTAVDLRNRLATATGVRLPATLVFDHPTPAALTGSVLARVTPAAPSGAEAVLTELDQLESALVAVGPDDDIRDTVTVRLQTILARWREPSPAPSPEQQSTPDPGDALDSASTAELFSFIDNELGRARR
ncbi:KR domain-containing protein [Micromonospora sp. NPDC049523]|uniref:KR domain-containing protein n=1 Tax=Micromonospora sp. NPDC049523 TaxID=3155921 RepID=UPI0034389A55